MSKRERIAKWDNLKLILIFLVVLGHVIDTYVSDSTMLFSMRFFIYSFHIPAFFLLSGLFSKRIIHEKNGKLYLNM